MRDKVDVRAARAFSSSLFALHICFVSYLSAPSGLELRLRKLGDVILNRAGLGPALPLGRTTLDPAVFVGRVCCDGDGRLNAKSILLQGGADAQRVVLIWRRCAGRSHCSRGRYAPYVSLCCLSLFLCIVSSCLSFARFVLLCLIAWGRWLWPRAAVTRACASRHSVIDGAPRPHRKSQQTIWQVRALCTSLLSQRVDLLYCCRAEFAQLHRGRSLTLLVAAGPFAVADGTDLCAAGGFG